MVNCYHPALDPEAVVVAVDPGELLHHVLHEVEQELEVLLPRVR